MEITIDRAIEVMEYLKTQNPQLKSIDVAIDIMRKYQKIQEIARWNNAPSPYYKPDGQLFREIEEVLEDGNNNQHN